MKAKDFRSIAKNSLKGKWLIAVLVGLVAALLGGTSANGPEFKLEFNGSAANLEFAFAGQTLFSTGGGINSPFHSFILGSIALIGLLSLVFAVIYLILGSFIEVGYSKFNLELVDRQDPSFECLFSYLSYWKTALLTRFLKGLYVILWSLLLVIPGVIAAYRYSMTGYILAEYPEITASEALRRSRELMSGNKWRLFCLQFSFIGWAFLSTLTLGIGNLFLKPYRQAAEAAFYREISGSARHAQQEKTCYSDLSWME